MFAQPTQKRRSYLVPAALVITLAGVFASMAIAKVILNTIDPVDTVTGGGRQIVVTGPLRCDQGQRVDLGVTVTQRSTGALAEGDTLLTCAGDTQHWEVRASIRGNEIFQEGPATAVAVARTSNRGITDDAHQWLVNITLAAK